MSRPEIIVPDIIQDEIVTTPGNVPHIKRYQKGKFLGKGGFAKCYEMTSFDTGRTYACKVVPKSSLTKQSSKRKLLNEIKIHRSITHPNVVKFERFFEDKINVYILLELCTSKTLMELVHTRKRLTEPEAQCYMWQLVTCMQELHKQNIIHRDLKLGNLFLDANMDIKCGDFGLATRLEHEGERKRTLCGTPNYIAPEILDNNNGHSFEVDTWSIGVIMYTLLIGRPPFETTSVKSTYKRIRANSYVFPRHVVISSAAKQLITSILQSTAELRPSLAQISQHAFFTQSPFPKHLPLSALTRVPNLSSQEIQPVHTSGRVPFSDRTNEAPANTWSQTSKPASRQHTAPAQRHRERLPTRDPNLDRRSSRPSSSRPSNENTQPNRRNSPRIGSKSRGVSSAFGKTDLVSNVPMASTARSSGVRRPSSSGDDQLELIANDIKRLKLSEPDAAGHLDAEDKAEFRRVHNDIERSFCFTGGKNDMKSKSSMAPPRQMTSTRDIGVSVNKWVDYSNKYGVGYLLTNNNVGVYFNDSSQIIMSCNGCNFEYVERKGLSGAGVRVGYTMTNYPSSLQKKVTLLKHFHAYLKNKTKDSAPSSRGAETRNMVFVKKWLRTTHAILFRLSNQTVQVIFFDQTEILLSSSTRTVVYTDKQQQISSYPLDSVIDSPRPDLARRMRYTQDILFHLLSRRSSSDRS